ncbi:hypothetical protein WUBG_04597 [Wuchereria bancrofti]|uniref:Uncharacterized protein n=1 Tax=Wuchereria bancrofti TaxID=6293 RepID=J9BBH2_WUCBA|nr:hypothetical protein WUBG_04597 [Wuchereria bancrofti]
MCTIREFISDDDLDEALRMMMNYSPHMIPIYNMVRIHRIKSIQQRNFAFLVIHSQNPNYGSC